MASRISDKLIDIIPKTGYLGSDTLITLRHDQLIIECAEPDINAIGLKKTIPRETNEEAKILQHLYEQLEKQLNKPRIERLFGRTLAAWDENLRAVRVIRKDGKFQNFGYNYQGQHYLEYYEAMFLLEMNRLQLEYYGQIVSIEQAYLLLLGENASAKYSNYLIYSYLTRAGYILKKFHNIQYYNVQSDRPTTITETINQKTDEDCIWYIFEQELHSKSDQKNEPEQLCKNMPNYDKLKTQFQQFKKQIINPVIFAATTSKWQTVEHREEESEKLNFNRKLNSTLKRSATIAGITKVATTNKWHNLKRFCNKQTTPTMKGVNAANKSLLDFLGANEMFKKFDIIPLKNYEISDEGDKEYNEKKIIEGVKTTDDVNDNLIINFDVYLPRSTFRKSDPGPPDFRAIILKPNQSFPTHQQISKIYWQQLQQITLVIMAVNESKQVQSFLYYFS